MIPFHQALPGGEELSAISAALGRGNLAGDGEYCRLCEKELAALTGAKAVLLTCSCTAALELAALLLPDLRGREVIMPSYTFPSTANAFVLRGAIPVFVDIHPSDMNMNASLIEAAINPATRGIVVMHYAGMACDMDAIGHVAQKHGLEIIEDAAMGLMANYTGQHLGTMGSLGCLSFHHSKHFSMGEGGALLINDLKLLPRAEILRQKGADIASFRRGEVGKYCWQDIGSSYVPSELNAALLLPQLLRAEDTAAELLGIWNYYQQALYPLAQTGRVELPQPPPYARHNGHIYYIKAADAGERENLAKYLASRGIAAASHYQPLHTAPAGRKYARFHGEDKFTSSEAARLLRLPLWRGLTKEQIRQIAWAVHEFYEEGRLSHE